MATFYLTLKGTLKWAKVYEPDEYAGAKNWKVCFYPYNDKEWEKYNKTGLQLKKYEDTDGKYIQFRRPVQKLIGEELVVFSPPEINGKINVHYVDPDGNKIRQFNKSDKTVVSRVGEPENIGNGSVALVNFSYYSTVKGPGHRLEGITILDLVEYGGSTNDIDDIIDVSTSEGPTEKAVNSGKVTKETAKKTLAEDLNDDLPW